METGRQSGDPGVRILKGLVREAFLAARDGYSADAVIADPERDARFLATCRGMGTDASDFELNHCLYNLRKSRALEGYPTTRRARAARRDEYEFAVEIAARFLERRYNTTLDRFICDPVLAAEFDGLAQVCRVSRRLTTGSPLSVCARGAGCGPKSRPSCCKRPESSPTALPALT